MSKRKVTVISNQSAGTKVFESEATTLGDLKKDFARQGINYDNMDFLEGTTQTCLKDDRTQLPSDIEYRGETTNDLVIMLSTTNKRISSGK